MISYIGRKICVSLDDRIRSTFSGAFMDRDVQLAEQRHQPGREQQVVDIVAAFVLPNLDVVSFDQLSKVVLHCAHGRLGEHGHRGLREPAVVLLPALLKEQHIHIGCAEGDAAIMLDEARLKFVPNMEEQTDWSESSHISAALRFAEKRE